MRRVILLLLALALVAGPLCFPVRGQVIPPGTSTGGSPGSPFPETFCMNTVGVGLTAQGVLQCAPVTPAMTTGLVPSGQDVSSTGEVTRTHLQGPLPLPQGGLGLSSGPSGGILFFSSTTSVNVTATLAQNAPLFGGGPGAGPVTGTRSGTTLELATIFGPHAVGKQLTFDANGNVVASAADVGGGTGGVVSVFGRSGTVIAQPGDYTAAQVTNAADKTAANAFTHPAGQSMSQLILMGAISGTLALRAPGGAGTSLVVLPAGTTDFSATGGPNQVVRQITLGGPLVVGQLALNEISGTGSLCSSAVLCPGYQAALGYTAESTANKSADVALGVSNALYPSQGAVKAYVDTGLATKQNALGFAAEDVAHKSTDGALGTSTLLYPSQSAVKAYVDTQVATRQAALGFTAENVAQKSTDPVLGASTTLYPSQSAVKVYVDNAIATRQPLLAFTPENVALKSTDAGLGTSLTLYPSQSAVKGYVDAAVATRQAPLTWGAGLVAAGTTVSTASTETDFLTNGGTTPLACGVSASGRMQVLSTGELQYCDGATTSVLRSGVLTQSGLDWQVTIASCTSDPNGGKLTVTAAGKIICAADQGGSGGGGGGVTTVFGRAGAVVATSGDYTASQVSNAADLTAANTFTHGAGQSMPRLVLLGTSSGSLTLRTPPAAGSNTLTFPAGTTDFSTTGGAGQVVRQSSAGGPLSVSQLALSDLSGAGAVCTTSAVCAGYQAALGFSAENSANKSPSTSLGTSNTLYPTQGAVKSYVDTALTGKQDTLAFTPEDVARKSTNVALGTSNVLYPSQGAVKSYVDTVVATKQDAFGFTPENVGNKAISTSLGTSNTLYPSQGAVKSYVDTAVAGKQDAITWGTGLSFSGGTASVASAEAGFLTNGGATALTCGTAAAGKMQVLNTGQLQYCDGAGTSALRSGFLTQSGLAWNVTLSACTTDPNGGKLTVNGTGQIVCAGDSGSGTTAFSAITAGTVLSQALVIGNGSTFGPLGTGVVTANALTGALAIGSGSSLGPTGTGVLTANALTGTIVLASGSSLSTTGTGSLIATGIASIPDLSVLLTTTNIKKVYGKQNVPRVHYATASGSPLTFAADCDAYDVIVLDNITADLTLAPPVCTGTNPEPEQELEYRFFSATPRVLTWATPAFCANNSVALPTATTGNGTDFDRVKFKRNAQSACWGLTASTIGVAPGITTLASSSTFTCPWQVSRTCEMYHTGAAGAVTIAIPSGGTPANGKQLILKLRCDFAQTLTLTTGAGGFLASPNIPLTGLTCPAGGAAWTAIGIEYSTTLTKWQVYATN
jgi:hypothetical protein